MEEYILKSASVREIKDLYEDIDKCIGDLILARSKNDQRGISDAHWKMETLMVNTQQVLSYILQHLEVKEVDLEKEIKNEIDNLSNLYCYMEDLFDGIEEEGVFPIPKKVTNELFEFAKHFFELGLKVQKGE